MPIPGGQIISGVDGSVQKPHGQIFDTPSSGDRKRGGFLSSAKNREILKQTLQGAAQIFGSNKEEDEGMGGGVTGTGKGFGGSGATIPGAGAVLTPGEHAPFTVAGMKGDPGWGGTVGKIVGGGIGLVASGGNPMGWTVGSQVGGGIGGMV